MSSTLIQFRTDDASKIKASSICERLGIDLPPYYDGSRILDMIAPGGEHMECAEVPVKTNFADTVPVADGIARKISGGHQTIGCEEIEREKGLLIRRPSAFVSLSTGNIR